MSFTLTIRGIPDKELGPMLARMSLPKGVSFDTQHIPEQPAVTVTPKKGNGGGSSLERRLHMTGKIPRTSALIAEALTTFEKLEAKEGIGTVTVLMYRDELKKRKQDAKLQSRLLTEGYLEYLP